MGGLLIDEQDFDFQFRVDPSYYLTGMDFAAWYRYLVYIEEIIEIDPDKILEIGVGAGILRDITNKFCEKYLTLDINPRLDPDIVGDLRELNPSLEGIFDCVICSDVLEHIPFEDLELNLKNINKYLNTGGFALISIPHRRTEMIIITPTYKKILLVFPIWMHPYGFYSRFIKRKRLIDPSHCWEIGDGPLLVKRKLVDTAIKRSGFDIAKFQQLPYVDFWVLRKV